MTDRPLLVLIGPPAAGKSRIGKRVARELGVPFVDTDRRIVQAHGPIPQLFADHGEATFRALERVEVARALEETGTVVALGGGAVLDSDTQAQLSGHRVVLITMTRRAAKRRLALTGSTRPLLSGGIEAWDSLVEARTPIYERLAVRRWDTSARPVSHIASEIARWINETVSSEEA